MHTIDSLDIYIYMYTYYDTSLYYDTSVLWAIINIHVMYHSLSYLVVHPTNRKWVSSPW